MYSGRVTKYNSPFSLLSKDKGLKNIGNSISIRNLIFGVNSVVVSDSIRYEILLQNAIDVITKWDSYFITKGDRSLLENVLEFLFQNSTTLIQNATILLQNAKVITKCNAYYKLRHYILALFLIKFVCDLNLLIEFEICHITMN